MYSFKIIILKAIPMHYIFFSQMRYLPLKEQKKILDS